MMMKKNIKQKVASPLRKPSRKINWRAIAKALSGPKSITFVAGKAVFSQAFAAVVPGNKSVVLLPPTRFGKTAGRDAAQALH